MLELLIAIPLLLIFMLVTMSVLALLIQSAGYSSRGALELQIAMRLAEQFRNDTRQARAVAVSPARDAVVLSLEDGQVCYTREPDGRLRRTDAAGNTTLGPLLKAAEYSWDAKNPRLLRASWLCAAGENVAQPPSAVSGAGCLLVLDTALRGALTEEPAHE